MPSTSTAAEVSGNTGNTNRPDPWAAFKRKQTGVSTTSQPKKVCKEVRPKESPDPHICLICGSELSRGRDFNKKRHWIQKHSDQPAENYSCKIVPKNHELAQKFLQQKEKQEGKSKSKMTAKPKTPSKPDKSLEVPVTCSKVTPSLEAICPPPQPAVQSSLSGFVTHEGNMQTESRIQNMQSDLSRVVLMLESLTVPDRKRSPADVTIDKDISGVIPASRLTDVKHPDIIVDILEDGCRITCYTCQQFQLSHPKKNV